MSRAVDALQGSGLVPNLVEVPRDSMVAATNLARHQPPVLPNEVSSVPHVSVLGLALNPGQIRVCLGWP